jgi:hypothetical protein
MTTETGTMDFKGRNSGAPKRETKPREEIEIAPPKDSTKTLLGTI